jgi:hemerythrin-like domain-containing protein
VDEHRWIKRLLALIPDMVSEIRTSAEMDSDLLLATVDFIRGYADRFHHMKEEDILFDYTDREAEIVRIILQDHDRARGFVQAAVQAIEDGNRSALCANLISYRELLTEHITKEDEILYPYIDRELNTSQVGEIFRRFEEVESGMADDVPHRYEQFIINLTGRFQGKETIQ